MIEPMPQPKKATARKKATTRKPAAKRPARSAAPAPRAAKAAKPAPRVKPKPAQRRSKRTAAARSRTEAARDVALFDNLAVIRDLLAEQIVLSTDRLQEAIDDAVRRGRMLPTDAQDLGDRLRRSGRRQLDELLVDIDRRLGGR
jgi:hypothetical protein